jgi:hypothetical protein
MMPLRPTGRVALVLLVLFFFLSLAGIASVAARSFGRPPGPVHEMMVHDAAIVLKDIAVTVHDLGRVTQARLLVLGTHVLAQGLAWLDQAGLAHVEILT